MRIHFHTKIKPGPKVPPLGKRDLCLYWLGILLSGGCLGAMFVSLLWFWEDLTAMAAPEAICTSMESNSLWIMGGMVALAFCVTTALEKLEHRYPILGDSGVSYGGEKYDPVYPMLMQDENAPAEVKASVSKAQTKLVLWIMALVVGILLCLFALLGGTRLYPDGSIRTTVGFGEVTAEYSPEQIERIFLEVEAPSGRNRSPGEWWELKLTIRTQDNKLIEFCVHDFAADPSGGSEIDRLRQLLEHYPEEILRFEGGGLLGRLYGRYGYDAEDQAYLEELFGVK